VTAFGLRGWVDRGLAQQVPAYEEVDVGRIGTLLERLKALIKAGDGEGLTREFALAKDMREKLT